MLCISVAPVSRTLGKVDLLNAASSCDLVELRLDRLEKNPDIPDMLSVCSKPVMISCRRQSDGGSWDGTEEERLTLLRSAIVAGPAYVELELDIADKVPRFGKTKRVISYTRLDKPLSNLEPVYEKAVAAKADVVKFVGLTPTLDAAWPLLASVTKKHAVPVVGLGVGRPGVMFSLLGFRYGAPWVYAALEKGLEAYDGQATLTELQETWDCRNIGPNTRFVAVTGFGPREMLLARVMNAGFREHGLNFRCLPLAIGDTEKFRQALDILHVNVIIANPQFAERMLNVATDLEEGVRVSQYADLLVKQQQEWKAYNTLWRSGLRTLESQIPNAAGSDHPLANRNVLLIGSSGPARAMAYGIRRRAGLLSVTATNDSEGRQLAQSFEARFVPFASLYDTLCDVVVVAEKQTIEQTGRGATFNASFLRPGMTVLDVTEDAAESRLLSEARLRGCHVIEPRALSADQLSHLFSTMTGKPLPPKALEQLNEAT